MEEITEDFAYVLGVVYGDGYCRVRDRGGEITLKVKDEDFTENFKRSLDAYSRLSTKLTKKKDFYHAYLSSKKTAQQILDFEPNRILTSRDSIKISFLGGLFDSDGGILGQNLDNRKCAKRWIHFSNNNTTIIRLVTEILSSFHIKYTLKSRVHSGFGSTKLQYEIITYALKNLYWFHINNVFRIKRKIDKLKDVIASYEPKNLEMVQRII